MLSLQCNQLINTTIKILIKPLRIEHMAFYGVKLIYFINSWTDVGIPYKVLLGRALMLFSALLDWGVMCEVLI